MTVKDVMDRLAKEDPRMECVVDLHSEYAVVTEVNTVEGYDNGGYVSKPYPHRTGVDRTRVHGYVYIGP